MWDWVSKLIELKSTKTPAVLVTVVQTNASSPRDKGAKMIVLENGEFFGTIGGGNLEFQALNDAKKVFQQKTAEQIKYPLGAKTGQCCGGSVDLFFELINTHYQLYIFGAGHVAQAVCRVLKDSSFEIHVVDERKEWIESNHLDSQVVKHFGEFADIQNEIPIDSQRTFCVVMTHRHDLDQKIIEYFLDKNIRYLGLIGSQSKFEKFKQRWIFKGIHEDFFNKVKCPIGLPIGGKSPTEVAVSLAAELIQTIHKDAI